MGVQIQAPIVVPFLRLVFCVPRGARLFLRVTELQQGHHHGTALTLVESARLTVEDSGSTLNMLSIILLVIIVT